MVCIHNQKNEIMFIRQFLGQGTQIFQKSSITPKLLGARGCDMQKIPTKIRRHWKELIRPGDLPSGLCTPLY
jgi:hypothetical protein